MTNAVIRSGAVDALKLAVASGPATTPSEFFATVRELNDVGRGQLKGLFSKAELEAETWGGHIEWNFAAHSLTLTLTDTGELAVRLKKGSAERIITEAELASGLGDTPQLAGPVFDRMITSFTTLCADATRRASAIVAR